MVVPNKIINELKREGRCWNFFKVSRDHVLNSTKEIRKIINNINKKGYSDLPDLIQISKALDVIENQMPNNQLEG